MSSPQNSAKIDETLFSYNQQSRYNIQGPGAQSLKGTDSKQLYGDIHSHYKLSSRFRNRYSEDIYSYSPEKTVYNPFSGEYDKKSIPKCDTGKCHESPGLRSPIKESSPKLARSTPCQPQQQACKSILARSVSCNVDTFVGPTVKRSSSAPTPQEVAARLLNPPIKPEVKSYKTTENDHSKGVHYGEMVEPRVIMPPPASPKPCPVIARSDRSSSVTDPFPLRVYQTKIHDKPIPYFNIGGEPRLCLAVLLSYVIPESLAPCGLINQLCDELRIFCQRCTPAQVQAFKDTGYLPSEISNVGLITKTDAYRLIHAIHNIHNSMVSSDIRSSKLGMNIEQPKFVIMHSCFGKAKGAVWTDLYVEPNRACIECLHCNKMYSPPQFVCHAHQSIENTTCHWGFDVEKWRCYIMLARQQDQKLDRPKAQIELEAFKAKFSDPFSAINHKRKQVLDINDIKKRVRSEDVAALGYGMPGVEPGGYYPSSYVTWSPVMVSKDGKQYIMPHPIYQKEDLPGVALPAYLDQGPPILDDPARVIPSSESKNFERDFQPNVALATPQVAKEREQKERDSSCTQPTEVLSPPKIEGSKQQKCDKLIAVGKASSPGIKKFPASDRNSSNGKSIEDNGDICIIKVERFSDEEVSSHNSKTNLHQDSSNRLRLHPKNNAGALSPTLSVSQSSPPNSRQQTVSSSSTIFQKNSLRERGKSSPVSDVAGSLKSENSTCKMNGLHPDLQLSSSTSDSDTESVNSVSSKSELIEQAEALMRGWNDRAAARKVLEMFMSSEGELNIAKKQLSDFSRKKFHFPFIVEENKLDNVENKKQSHDICAEQKPDIKEDSRALIRSLQDEIVHLRQQLRKSPVPKTNEITINDPN